MSGDVVYSNWLKSAKKEQLPSVRLLQALMNASKHSNEMSSKIHFRKIFFGRRVIFPAFFSANARTFVEADRSAMPRVSSQSEWGEVLRKSCGEVRQNGLFRGVPDIYIFRINATCPGWLHNVLEKRAAAYPLRRSRYNEMKWLMHVKFKSHIRKKMRTILETSREAPRTEFLSSMPVIHWHNKTLRNTEPSHDQRSHSNSACRIWTSRLKTGNPFESMRFVADSKTTVTLATSSFLMAGQLLRLLSAGTSKSWG